MRGVALNTDWQLGHGERFAARLPAFVREVLTGIGQCMLQGDARTGLLFVIGSNRLVAPGRVGRGARGDRGHRLVAPSQV